MPKQQGCDRMVYGWRLECRACGASLVTHLMGDVQVWLTAHDHKPDVASPPPLTQEDVDRHVARGRDWRRRAGFSDEPTTMKP